MNFLFEAFGWVGSFCFLYSYYMLIKGKWGAQDKLYHIYNILGSILFVANGIFYLAWAVVFINLAWGGIAVYGLYKTYQKQNY